MGEPSPHPETAALERCLTSVSDACARLADECDRLRAENKQLQARIRGLTRTVYR